MRAKRKCSPKSNKGVGAKGRIEMRRPGILSASCAKCPVSNAFGNAGLDEEVKIVTIKLVMTNIVTFSRTLADSTRWRIVRLVMDEALCVCELADILGMPPSSVSSHVQIIRKSGLLESEKCGKWTYFRIGRHYLNLVRTMEKFFAGTGDDAWIGDTEKFARRLEIREQSCCPGPTKFTPRSRSKIKTMTAR